jgi:hypothetical protein
MTFNFGHKLLLAFILFGMLMFYLVYQSLHTNFELVSKDYYQDELVYQQVIDATKNAKELSTATSISQKGGEVYVQLPAEMANQQITGNINFYCAADSKKDHTIPLAPDASGLQVIAVGKELANAAYRVRITWTAKDKKYYQDSFLQVSK